MKKIYILSPYTHDNPKVMQERYEKACKYAGKLIEQGHNAYSPIAHSHGIAIHSGLPLTADYWWPINREMIDWADECHVLQIPGWEESKGMAEELIYCNKRLKPVYFIKP
jgi:hypothetical protein